MSAESAKIYNSAKWKQIRARVLSEEPVCHWCGRRPSTQADHIVELARGGAPYDRENLVGSCQPCNSKRGSTYQARQNAARTQARKEWVKAPANNSAAWHNCLICNKPFIPDPKNLARGGGKYCTVQCAGVARRKPTKPKTVFGASKGIPRPHFSSLSEKPETIETDQPAVLPSFDGSGAIGPRLITPVRGGESWGADVAAWSERNLGVTLFPWQRVALEGQLSHRGGKLVHREALVSTARQNGKTVALSALAGWWLTDHARSVGPQSVVTTAHKLDRAVSVFRELAPVLEEKHGGKVTWSYGRNRVELPDGSVWQVMAATPSNAHGSTNDLVIVDEVWNISSDVIFDAYRPSMIARKNPMLSMWSTAGDESSTVMLQLREQAMQHIESGEQGNLFMAEWSPPPGMDYKNPEAWRWANPALGHTITTEALLAASNTPDWQAFLRAHANVWVSSASAWLPHGLWDSFITDDPMPAGGYLAIDTDLEDLRYVAVRAAPRADGTVQVQAEFVANSMPDMWQRTAHMLKDHSMRLLLTPGLADLCPPALTRRMQTVGQQEMYLWTLLVRNMIMEGRIKHPGQVNLSEHVGRAVSARSQNKTTLSSQKSPGPIELARCMVWAVACASKPSSEVSKPAFGVSRT